MSAARAPLVRHLAQEQALPPASRSSLLRGRSWPWTALLLWALACTLLVVHAARFWDITVDDAAISYTYARNLAEGHGLVLNPGGERVEAFSNPAWVLLLALLHLGGIGIEAGSKVLGVLLAMAALGCMLLAGIGSRPHGRGPRTLPTLHRPLAASVGSLAAAGSTVLALWSVSGMETGLHACLLMGLLCLLAAEDQRAAGFPWSCVLLLPLLLTRPEAPLYWVAAGLFKALRLAMAHGRLHGRGLLLRREILWLLLCAAAAGSVFLGRWLYFDALLPNSYYIKQTTFSFDLLAPFDLQGRGWRYVGGFLSAYFLWPFLLLLPLGLIQGRRRGPTLAGLGLLSAGVYFPLYSQGDWMPEHRFLAPLLPLFFLLAAWGGESLLGLILGLRGLSAVRGRLRVLAASAACVLFLWAALHRAATRVHEVSPARFTLLRDVEQRARYFAHAAHLATAGRASLLDPDLGGSSWSSGLRVLDLFGLADRMLPSHRWDQPLVREYLLGELAPDFIHLHGAWLSAYFLQEYPELEQGWVRLPVRVGPGLLARGRNYARRSLFARLWEPLPERRALVFPGSGLRMLRVDPGDAAVAPGSTLRLELCFVPARRLDARPKLTLLLAAWPAPLTISGPKGPIGRPETVQWRPDARQDDEGPGGVLLGFRCRAGADPWLRPRLRSLVTQARGEHPAVAEAELLAYLPRGPSHGECLWSAALPGSAPAKEVEIIWPGPELREESLILDLPGPELVQTLDLGSELYPPESWQPGEVQRTMLRIDLPASVPEGRYQLLLGLSSRTDRLRTAEGLRFAQAAQVEIGREPFEAGYGRLLMAVSEALACARQDRARLALLRLIEHDDGRAHPSVERARSRVAAAMLTTVLSLASAGDLEAAAHKLDEVLDLSSGLASAERVRWGLANELLQRGRHAARQGDPDTAFSLLGLALRLGPQLSSARTLLEGVRRERSSFYSPFLLLRARGVGLAYGLSPSVRRHEAVIDALADAQLDAELIRFCPQAPCGMSLDPSRRTLLARAYRGLGYLNGALALLEGQASEPMPLAAGLLRQDILSLLGRRSPPGELRELLERLPAPRKRALGPDLWLRGMAWAPDRDERVVLRLYFQRSGLSVAPRRGVLQVKALSREGSFVQARDLYLPGGRLFMVELPIRLPEAEHRLFLRIEGGAAEVDLGRIELAVPNFGFEYGSTRGWEVVGQAFSGQPVRGGRKGQRMVTGYRGRYLVNGFLHGDQARGSMLSAPFTLDAKVLSFLIGGGKLPGRLGVRLRLARSGPDEDEQELLMEATGTGSERMQRVYWDVSAWQGREVRLELFDQAGGAWGHLLFDDLQLLPALPLGEQGSAGQQGPAGGRG